MAYALYTLPSCGACSPVRRLDQPDWCWVCAVRCLCLACALSRCCSTTGFWTVLAECPARLPTYRFAQVTCEHESCAFAHAPSRYDNEGCSVGLSAISHTAHPTCERSQTQAMHAFAASAMHPTQNNEEHLKASTQVRTSIE